MTIVPGLRTVGDRGVLVELPGNATVRKLAPLVSSALAGLEDVVPGHDTLLLTWEPGRTPPRDLAGRLAELLGGPSAVGASDQVVHIPVVYDGPDLAPVAATCGMSPEEVVRRHLAAEYDVAFVGFAPGFAYLVGGDPALRPPRRAEPRVRVPAGSLAVAGEYSAVYPAESPGGWNLLGRATLDAFDLQRDPPSALQTGMRVRFHERTEA